ncbi:MAG: Sec-independent protein translocase subunit TatA [Actinobacteria bacterium]|nr:Sec-independent protein translocase subunit TatA [Actinomycetota bacterium]
MGNFRGWEWILILLLALLLFGGFKKLPDAARGVGRSLRIFKAETKGLQDDDDGEESSSTEPSTDANSAAKPSAISGSDKAADPAGATGESAPAPHPVSSKSDNSSSTTSSGSSERTS